MFEKQGENFSPDATVADEQDSKCATTVHMYEYARSSVQELIATDSFNQHHNGIWICSAKGACSST
jgi:hypothetical protein